MTAAVQLALALAYAGLAIFNIAELKSRARNGTRTLEVIAFVAQIVLVGAIGLLHIIQF
jgi:hypothetical protein